MTEREKKLADTTIIQKTKPPVVVVVGHVDHGKSTLLEAIRKDFKIIERESGGITQHIGAYEVEIPSTGSGQIQKITFIDTPGHEAFSAMRQRGAKVADIAILVIDATEGVKEQTKEAIRFIKEAEIPMVVAINKIDKPEAQPEKVKQELAKSDVNVESFGGKIPSVNISAKTGEGIKELLETILIVAEMEDLKADTLAPGEGTIIEAYLNSQKGPIATLLVKNGVLKINDIIGTSTIVGKIKSLCNFQGNPIEMALPSQPVQALGFNEVPKVGEKFKVYQDAEQARQGLKKEEKIEKSQITPPELQPEKTLNIILKADVLGSLEALEKVLKSIPQKKVGLKILKSEVGNIEASDIKLAESGRARIFGFRVKINTAAKSLSQQKKIFPKLFDVIYEMVEEIRKTMEKSLGTEKKVIELGKMEILATFGKIKNNQIIGGKVIEGIVENKASLEITRDNEVIGKGKIANLQQNKKDMDSVKTGKEAGILFAGNVKIKEGDILRIFKEEEIKQTI